MMLPAVLPATALPLAASMPAVPVALANARHDDPLRALLQQVEGRHAGAHQGLVRNLAALGGPAPSPAAMLRLQAAVGEFTVRVQLSVRLAEDLSRSLQTLTQRT